MNETKKCPFCAETISAGAFRCKFCGHDAFTPTSATATPQPPQYQSAGTTNYAAWYYSHNGSRVGPISVSAVQQLIAAGTINAQTMVWRTGMSDWLPAQQTELGSLLSWRSTPPPLMGEAVNNSLVWTVAFVPIISSFLQVALAAPLGTQAGSLWFIAPILNIILCLADEANLKKAGHDTKGMGLWAVFLVPVYLFVRAARLKQSNGYAIVWLVTFLLSLFIPLAG